MGMPSMKKSTMSPDLPLRPRLSRYDRPAQTLQELLKGDGTDFVFQAVWTMHGQRVCREQHDALLDVLQGEGGKPAVLSVLAADLAAEGKQVSLPGLSLILLVEKRRNKAIIGPLLARATVFADRYPIVTLPGRFMQAIPGKVRWTYRHSRKLLIRLASCSGLPSQTKVRRTLGVSRASAMSDMTDRAAWLYTRLCEAVDRPTDAK